MSHEALDGVRPSAPAAVQQQLQQLDVDEDDMLKVGFSCICGAC